METAYKGGEYHQAKLAVGWLVGLHGDWKWFRKDGVIMRSGTFKAGKQVGVWITYDQKGKPYKKTNFGS